MGTGVGERANAWRRWVSVGVHANWGRARPLMKMRRMGGEALGVGVFWDELVLGGFRV